MCGKRQGYCRNKQGPQKAVEEGRFREDIYYRLNVVNIHLPPLSERPEDIQYLFEYFLETYNEKYAKHISVDKEKIYPLLISYPWPEISVN
jgi:transcriptional regulator with PAS, ATPase and Fis domain